MSSRSLVHASGQRKRLGIQRHPGSSVGKVIAGLGAARIHHGFLSGQATATPNAEPKTVACSTCGGLGAVRADGLISKLQGLSKPLHFTSAPPGPAPKDCRWICRLCHGNKEIKTRSNDLRVHLKKEPHLFSPEEIEQVFDPKGPNAFYEHFGPVTEHQAFKNGWPVRSWSKPSSSCCGNVQLDTACSDDVTSVVNDPSKRMGMQRIRNIFLLQLGEQARKTFAEQIGTSFSNDPTLPGTSLVGSNGQAVQQEQSSFEGGSGVKSDASNQYFASAMHDQGPRQILPAAGGQFEDVILPQQADPHTIIEERFGNGDETWLLDGNKLHFYSQQPDIMLSPGYINPAQLTEATGWGKDAFTNRDEQVFHHQYAVREDPYWGEEGGLDGSTQYETLSSSDHWLPTLGGPGSAPDDDLDMLDIVSKTV